MFSTFTTFFSSPRTFHQEKIQILLQQIFYLVSHLLAHVFTFCVAKYSKFRHLKFSISLIMGKKKYGKPNPFAQRKRTNRDVS